MQEHCKVVDCAGHRVTTKAFVILRVICFLLVAFPNLRAQTLSLPPRPADAPTGSAFAESISTLDRTNREEKIYDQIASGNVPDFLRKLVSVRTSAIAGGKTNVAIYYVTPDYLAVGSDADYFLTPLTSATAQRVADLLQCSLPTRKMVNDIYSAAAVKLVPAPIPPSAAMTTVPVFMQHNLTVGGQRKSLLLEHPPGTLVAGHKKDVVIFRTLDSTFGRVGIYGWHTADGKPVQPLYTGHADTWVDYSHGIRLVQLALEVNGARTTVPEVLANPNLAELLSDEGTFSTSRYLTNSRLEAITKPPIANTNQSAKSDPVVTLADFQPGGFGEREYSYILQPEIKVHLNASGVLDPRKKLKLIFFALPNGNTTAQTIGKQMQPGDDWRYDIQHIGAQTRFVRQQLSEWNIVVAYLEATGKSWPAWRKAHADQPHRIAEVVASIKGIFTNAETEVTLSGHSGGGSFIFGYLNGLDQIPDDVARIAFLDSNYAYDPAQGHTEKFARWLRSSREHRLIVLAYDDASALLNGTNFVSAAGGTWGKSHQMIKDLGQMFPFNCETNAGFEMCFALNHRLTFLLKDNPQKEIFHTVQVERNGFIHCLLSGTEHENTGYTYFGPRVYTNWISKQ